MKAIVITVMILNGPPNFAANVTTIEPYQDCLYRKEVLEKGAPATAEYKGAKVLKMQIECQPVDDDIFNGLARQYEEK